MSVWDRLGELQKWQKLMLLALVALFVGLMWVAQHEARKYVDFWDASGELEKTAAESKALGLPMVASEVDPRGPASPEDNAAPLVRALQAKMHATGTTKAKVEVIRKLARDEKWDELRIEVKRLKPVLDMARLVSQRPRASFGRDVDIALFDLPKYPGEIKQIATLLVSCAVLAAHEGDLARASADLVTARRLGRLASDDPTTVGALVELSILSLACESATHAVNVARSPAQVERLREAVRSFGPPVPITRALRGEFYEGLASLRNLDFNAMIQAKKEGKSLPEVAPKTVKRSGFPAGIIERANLMRYLEGWNASWVLLRESDNDPRGTLQSTTELDARLDSQPGMSRFFSSIFFIGTHWFVAGFMRPEAIRTMALISFDIRDYQLNHGRLPQSLSELGPVPLDPFDGKPIRYRLTKDGYRLWSISMDLIDNGGITPKEATRASLLPNKPKEGSDIVVAYPPIPK